MNEMKEYVISLSNDYVIECAYSHKSFLLISLNSVCMSLVSHIRLFMGLCMDYISKII